LYSPFSMVLSETGRLDYDKKEIATKEQPK
jgi:hypothetical protein